MYVLLYYLYGLKETYKYIRLKSIFFLKQYSIKKIYSGTSIRQIYSNPLEMSVVLNVKNTSLWCVSDKILDSMNLLSVLVKQQNL